MAKDKLEVAEDGGMYWISWWLSDVEDYGASLGDDGARCPYSREQIKAEQDLEKRESMAFVIAAYSIALPSKPYSGHVPHRGFYWESRRDAEAALRQIKAEAKAILQGAGLPEWAKTALAQGWKPPRGWKPA